MNLRWDKLAAQGAIRTGMLTAVEKWEARQPNILRILAYHRIGNPGEEDGSLDSSLLNTTPQQFAEQMAYLKQHVHLVSGEELVHAVQTGTALPPRSVMVTFDDGYMDFAERAWPVLERLKIPTIMFIPTAYMDGTVRWYWWDTLYNAFSRTGCQDLVLPSYGRWELATEAQRRQAGREVKWILMNMEHQPAMDLLNQVVTALEQPHPEERVLLDWEDLRGLQRRGLVVAAHTRTHPILSRVDSESVRQEVAGSLQDLEENLGETLPLFAYPVGHAADLTHQLPQILQAEGVAAAVTMIAGHNAMGKTDPLRLRRVGMAPHMTLDEFRLVLTGFYNLYGVYERFRERKR